MTKYRPHRELLADSMKEVIEVATRAQLVEHLRRSVMVDCGHGRILFPPDELPNMENTEVAPYYGFDHRIGWNTHIVTVNGAAWGFTDGPLP